MVLRQALLPRLLACLLVLLAGCSSAGDGGGAPAWADGMPTVQEADLPAEAQRTLDLVDTGGPFPYEEDGTVFGNFEGLLPQRENGHYLEYTVRTPGATDRGAQRIVFGVEGETYCTDNHYASFTAVLR
ncbi:ribonuclease domain-containing protein [Streptomyces sp. SM1]|uniref:ribonuclease domain-containing protein n=1 Tax=Streptomyces sp. SM1 TaxID=402229 RepID=UPI000CD4E653|nr:ribonuclease domain-containing protein [Streptomyces sp. SM1]